MSSDGAVVLVSGGMDSLATAALAHRDHDRLFFLHADYGQKTSGRERACFLEIADFYGIPEGRRKIVRLEFLKEIGGSSLTDEAIAVKEYTRKAGGIPDSYVPFRNTHLLASAVSWAEVVGAKSVYIGAVEEDSSGYPDCRSSYYEAYNRLIREGTRDGGIRIVTPVISLKKHEIVAKAVELGAPLEASWSCYADARTACGRCDSCVLRLKGFRRAGIKDPIEYAS